jgi:hypothetical protein
MQGLTKKLTALREMSPAQLREKYLEVFGEPSRSGNKDFLFKRIAWRLQSLAEGGLSERARQRAAELARDADIRTTLPRPPKVTPGAPQHARAAPSEGRNRLAEYRVKTQGRGRTVDEWKLRADGLDNHWLDGLVGSAVAASMSGAVLFGTDAKKKPRRRIKLSDIQRANWAKRG